MPDSIRKGAKWQMIRSIPGRLAELDSIMSAHMNDPPNNPDGDDYAVGRPVVRAVDRGFVPYDAPTPIRDIDRPELVGTASEPTQSLGRFYGNVYTFPFRGRASLRWLLLTIGLAPALAIPAFVIDQANWLAVGSLAILPFFACLVWSVLYGSALFFCVAEATAAGANTVEEWPGEDWHDWIDRVIQIGYTFGVAAAIGIALVNTTKAGASLAYPDRDWSFLTPFSYVYWGLIASLAYFLFPIVLMSSMQAHSRWTPLTLQVLRSLVSINTAWLWLVFWLAELPIAALVYGQIAFAVRGWYALTGAGLGALLAASLMIYARLFGRLGWEIGERLSSEPKPTTETSANEPDEEEAEDPGIPAIAGTPSQEAEPSGDGTEARSEGT